MNLYNINIPVFFFGTPVFSDDTAWEQFLTCTLLREKAARSHKCPHVAFKKSTMPNMDICPNYLHWKPTKPSEQRLSHGLILQHQIDSVQNSPMIKATSTQNLFPAILGSSKNPRFSKQHPPLNEIWSLGDESNGCPGINLHLHKLWMTFVNPYLPLPIDFGQIPSASPRCHLG